jgi:hypothetical protein
MKAVSPYPLVADARQSGRTACRAEIANHPKAIRSKMQRREF